MWLLHELFNEYCTKQQQKKQVEEGFMQNPDFYVKELM